MELMTDQRFRRTIKYIRACFFLALTGTALALLLVFAVLGYAKMQGAPPLAVPQSTLYYSDDGTIIGESNSGQKRYWVPLEEMSPNLLKATIAIEDRGFYEHFGFDFKRIGGAIIADIKAMAKVQGASTITQQYARNLFLGHDKTWKRKLTEAFYTIRLEMNYSKKEILEGYLNTIYYGNGAYGAQAASQFYFGKNASELSIEEATLLAGIPKGPSYYSPFASEERAKQRQKIILNAMVEKEYLKKDQVEGIYARPLNFVGKHQHAQVEKAPYFQDTVRQILKNKLNLDERTITLGGLRVYTTLDVKQQEIAEEVVDQIVASGSEIQTGMVAMDPETGYVRAMIGGRNYEESPFNRAVQAVRQPGSTIKPLLYYAALEQGFTPSTLMRSEMTTFRFDDGRAEYTPRNFNNHYAEGDITMLQALALSDNVFAVKTHLFLGEKTLVDTVKKFGIKSKMSEVPSLALGTSGVQVLEMANAYSMFANGGKKVNPILVKRVENHQGQVIYEYKEEPKQVLKPAVASVMTNMLAGIFDESLNGYSSVTGRTLIKDMTRQYAGKSGSTDTDSWMIGYTPQLVTAVWTGYDKGKTIDLVAEKSYAKNIWLHFMENALKEEPKKKFKPAQGTVGVYINPENGKLATEDCPVKRMTYYVEGTEPQEYCTDHIDDSEAVPEPKEKEEKPKSPWYKKLLDWIP